MYSHCILDIPFWVGLAHFRTKADPSLTNSTGTSTTFSNPSEAIFDCIYINIGYYVVFIRKPWVGLGRVGGDSLCCCRCIIWRCPRPVFFSICFYYRSFTDWCCVHNLCAFQVTLLVYPVLWPAIAIQPYSIQLRPQQQCVQMFDSRESMLCFFVC